MTPPIEFDFSKYNHEQKWLLMMRLEDEIMKEAQAYKNLPLSAEVMAELDRRDIAYRAGEMATYTWEQVRDTVLRRSEEIHAGRAATVPWEQVRGRLFREP